MNTIDILPRIESRTAFEQLARAYDLQIDSFSDACRADNKLRTEKRGYAPSNLLRQWYGCYGYQRHQALERVSIEA